MLFLKLTLVCVEFLSLVSSCILFTGLSLVAFGGRFCCWDLGAQSLDVALKEVVMGKLDTSVMH